MFVLRRLLHQQESEERYLHTSLGPARTTARSEPLTDEPPVDTPTLWHFREFDQHLAELTDLFDEVNGLGLAEKLPGL